MANLTYPAYVPTEDDTQLSKESRNLLVHHLGPGVPHLKIVESDGSEKTVAIPAAAYRLLVDVLTQMSEGNAVTLIPIHAKLTTQEAAELLNVSRPYLIKQIEAGKVPHHKVGRHRRIRFDDLMAYKEQQAIAQVQAIDDLVAETEALGLYD